MKNFCLFALALLNSAIAQMAPQPLPELSRLEGDNYVFGWEGLPGRVYFIQTTSQVSSSDGFSWQFAPDIRVGTGSQIEMGFAATSDAPEFFRLVYTDYSGSLDQTLLILMAMDSQILRRPYQTQIHSTPYHFLFTMKVKMKV